MIIRCLPAQGFDAEYPYIGKTKRHLRMRYLEHLELDKPGQSGEKYGRKALGASEYVTWVTLTGKIFFEKSSKLAVPLGVSNLRAHPIFRI